MVKQNDNVVGLNIMSFSSEKPKDYNLLLLKNKIFDKTNQTLNVKKFDENIYFDDISKIILDYKTKKGEINSSNQENKHKILEENYEELTRKIGHLNDSLELPSDFRYLIGETKNVINAVKKDGEFSIGLNSFLAPGSLTSFRKVMEYKIVESKNISINLGNGVNIQEGIRFVKHSTNGHAGAITHFDAGTDDIENIKINLGDNSSVAHGVVFQAKNIGNHHFEYDLKTKENVFLGINAQIGSSVNIGENVSIWWGSIIKDNVIIGNNVVIGEGVKIKENIKIPNNCLVPNGAIIRDNYEVVKYEEYIKNQLKYDTKKVEKRRRRNFVIKFDDNLSREEQIKLMNEINSDYLTMAVFNEALVSPENKLFAVINTMLSIINTHFPNVGIIKEEEFKSNLTFEQVKARMPYMEDELIKNELQRPVKLSVKAFPKNKEKFLSELIPELIESIKNKKDITDKIKSYLDYPEIPKNKESVFLGTNTFTGKAKIDEKSLVYDTYIRSDETKEKDRVEINNSVVIKGILHGGKDKILNNSNVTCTVVHGKMLVDNTNIGHYKHHSVYHDCELDEVNQNSGGVVANGVNIKKSKIGFGVLFMPFKDFETKSVKWNIEKSDIGDYVMIGNSHLKHCSLDDESYIGNGLSFVGKYIEGKIYGKDKHLLETHIGGEDLL